MRRFLRNGFTWFALALFGAASFLGQGLHRLTPQGGGCCPAPVAEVPTCHDAHCSGHAHASTAGRHLNQLSASLPLHDSATCPICQFYAQAKAPVAPGAFEFACQFVSYARSVEALSLAPIALSAYDSRGPPLG
jgi:hypothetical protein